MADTKSRHHKRKRIKIPPPIDLRLFILSDGKAFAEFDELLAVAKAYEGVAGPGAQVRLGKVTLNIEVPAQGE